VRRIPSSSPTARSGLQFDTNFDPNRYALPDPEISAKREKRLVSSQMSVVNRPLSAPTGYVHRVDRDDFSAVASPAVPVDAAVGNGPVAPPPHNLYGAAAFGAIRHRPHRRAFAPGFLSQLSPSKPRLRAGKTDPSFNKSGSFLEGWNV